MITKQTTNKAYIYITEQDLKDILGFTPDPADQQALLTEAILRSGIRINGISGNRIEQTGFTNLSTKQQEAVKNATAIYCKAMLDGVISWERGSTSQSGAGVSYSQSNPEEPDYIFREIYIILQNVGLYIPRQGITNSFLGNCNESDNFYSPVAPNDTNAEFITRGEALATFTTPDAFKDSNTIGWSKAVTPNRLTPNVKISQETGNNLIVKQDGLYTTGGGFADNGLDPKLQSAQTPTGTPFIQHREATDNHIFFLYNPTTQLSGLELSGTTSLSLIVNRDEALKIIATEGPTKSYVKILKNLDMSKYNINNVVSISSGDSPLTSAGISLNDTGVNIQAVGPTTSKGVFSVNVGASNAPVPILVGSDEKLTIQIPLDMDQEPIRNLLAGIADTDAVNVGQLFQKIIDTLEAGTNITLVTDQSRKKLVINAKGGTGSGTWNSDLTKSYDEATNKLTHILKGVLDDYSNGFVDIAVTNNATNNELDFTVGYPQATTTIPKIAFKIAKTNADIAQLTITATTLFVNEQLDMGSNKITNMANGSDPQDAMAIGQVYAAMKPKLVGSPTVKIAADDTNKTFTFTSTGKTDVFNIIIPTKKYLKISKEVVEMTLNIPLFKSDQQPINNQIIQTFAVGSASVRNTITSVNNIDPTALAFEIYSFDTPDKKIEYYIWNKSDFDNAIYINTATIINSSEIFLVDNVPSGAVQEPVEWVKFQGGLANPIVSVLENDTTAVIGIKDYVNPTIWKYAIQWNASKDPATTPVTNIQSGGNIVFQVLGQNFAQFAINNDNNQSKVPLYMGDENIQNPITYLLSTPDDRQSAATVGWVKDNFGAGSVTSVTPDTVTNSIVVTPATGKGEVKIAVSNPLPRGNVFTIKEVTERPEIVLNAYYPTATGSIPTWSLRVNYQNGGWGLLHDNIGNKFSFSFNNDGTSPESGKLNCNSFPLINVGDAVNGTDAVNLKVLGAELAKIPKLADNLKSQNSTQYGGIVGALDGTSGELAQTGYNDNKLGDLLHQFTSSWTVKIGNGSTAKPIKQIMQLRYIDNDPTKGWEWEMATPIKMYKSATGQTYHITLARDAIAPLEAVTKQQLDAKGGPSRVDILTADKVIQPDTTLSTTSKLVYILTGDATPYLSVQPDMTTSEQWIFKVENLNVDGKMNTFTAKSPFYSARPVPPNFDYGPATTTMWGNTKGFKRTFSYFSQITRLSVTSICLNIECESGNFDAPDQGQALAIFEVWKLNM